MDISILAAVTVGLLLIFFAAGLHVAVALGLVAFSLMFFFSDRPLWDIIGQMAWNTGTSTSLVAVPLFILMGELLVQSGLTERIYRAVSNWLNPLPGGLLHSNIGACAIFAAVSGSTVATAATVGSIAMPAFRERGYNERLVLGSLAAGGTLGILIPPSINMIIYGVLAEESIGRLYMGGVFPGLVMALLFSGVIVIAATVRPGVAPKEQTPPWGEKLLNLVHILPIAALIFLVLGTIYLGVATATEAAAFGTVGAFAIAVLSRRMTFKTLGAAFISSVITTSMVMLLMVGAKLLNFALAMLGVPSIISRSIGGLGVGPLEFILILIGFYIILGCFMDVMSMMVITLPVIFPTLKALNIDLVVFGILFVILSEMALITPPVGLNVYVIQGMRTRLHGGSGTITDVFIGALPFMLAMLVVLSLVLAFPQMVLWLPTRMKGA